MRCYLRDVCAGVWMGGEGCDGDGARNRVCCSLVLRKVLQVVLWWSSECEVVVRRATHVDIYSQGWKWQDSTTTPQSITFMYSSTASMHHYNIAIPVHFKGKALDNRAAPLCHKEWSQLQSKPTCYSRLNIHTTVANGGCGLWAECHCESSYLIQPNKGASYYIIHHLSHLKLSLTFPSCTRHYGKQQTNMQHSCKL